MKATVGLSCSQKILRMSFGNQIVRELSEIIFCGSSEKLPEVLILFPFSTLSPAYVFKVNRARFLLIKNTFSLFKGTLISNGTGTNNIQKQY